MANNSSTGGYLVPTTILNEVNDEALRVFLQQIVVGITATPGNLVRPLWQAEPLSIPDFGVDWAAVGCKEFHPDKFSAVIHSNGQDLVYRNEVLGITCRFYGPNCESKAQLLSIGLQVSQNREQMSLAGYSLIEVDDPVMMPEQVNTRWMTVQDVGFRFRRTQLYIYPIFDVLQVVGTSTVEKNSVNFVSTREPISLPMFAFDINSGGALAGFDSGNWR